MLLKLKESFDLEITVKANHSSQLEKILRDNNYAYNAVRLVYNNLMEFTIYSVNFTKVSAIIRLIKDAEIQTY